MNRLFVIFNPAARGEKSQRLVQFLTSKAGNSVTLAATERAGDAGQLAAKAVADGFGCIVAAGGDGTINEISNGMGPCSIPLGVLPMGTVNVFACELGIPKSLQAAWAVIENGKTRMIDLAKAESNGVTRYFVQ